MLFICVVYYTTLTSALWQHLTVGHSSVVCADNGGVFIQCPG